MLALASIIGTASAGWTIRRAPPPHIHEASSTSSRKRGPRPNSRVFV